MLRLTAAETDTPFAPRIPDTDVAREAAETRTLADPLGLVPGAITSVRVKTGRFTLNACVNTLKPADRLVVTFAGPRAAARADSPNTRWPLYERRGFDLLFASPILAISDPQTELEWGGDVPRAGLYAGTFADDLVPELLALVEKVREELGLPADRVVFYGACAGGTAAMLAASRREHPTQVIAVNPPLRPEKFRTVLVTHASMVAGGRQDDWNELVRDKPWRVHPLVAMKDALQAQHDLRVFVAQNVRDRTTINRHFPGFWRRFDIDPDGGVSPDGRMCATLYDDEDEDTGHEPRALSRALVREAFAFFDAPLVVTPKKKAKAAKDGAGTPDAGESNAD